MIYSVKLQKEVPVSVESSFYDLRDFGKYTRYVVKDKKIPIGYIDLQDIENGVNVLYIKNNYPDLYKRFGYVADQIEVEHCAKRGLTSPYIKSVAAVGTLMQHFKRGKRFIDESINVFLEHILPKIKSGESANIGELGMQPMYMPYSLIQKYKNIMKRTPLIK